LENDANGRQRAASYSENSEKVHEVVAVIIVK
jgi:hypothetical protein